MYGGCWIDRLDKSGIAL